MAELRRALSWMKQHWFTTIAMVALAAVVGLYGFVLRDWFNVERVKTIAAVVQALGSCSPPCSPTSTPTDSNRQVQNESARERTFKLHDKRAGSMEKISEQMAIVVFKLGCVPNFYPDLDPVEPQEGADKSQLDNPKHYRLNIKINRFNKAIMDLREATQKGRLYINPSNKEHFELFVTNALIILKSFVEESEIPNIGGKDYMNFKERLKELEKLAESIDLEFQNQLQNPPV